jgi:FkbM family methyltransferase
VKPDANDRVAARLERLLGESLESARERQAGAIVERLGSLDRPFVLFGAGNLGAKTASTLTTLGYRPLALIDNNPAKWGTSIGGIEIRRPSDVAAGDRGDPPGVIVTTWAAEGVDRMSAIIDPLRELGYSRVAHFGQIGWRFPDQFLPHYALDLPEKVLRAASQVRAAFDLLDSDSRELFVDHIEWRLTLNFDLLPSTSEKLAYFDDSLIAENPDEVLYDLGGFTGDTVQDYLDAGKSYREIHSFEPEADNFAAMLQRFDALESPNIFGHRLAVGDVEGEVSVESGRGPSARIGAGDESVPMTTIDRLAQHAPAPTLIKLDIEAAEPLALKGGRGVISRTHPAIAVCVYHLQDHIWSIPLQLRDYHDGYRFSLCPHGPNGWDLVLYALPSERVPGAADVG